MSLLTRLPVVAVILTLASGLSLAQEFVPFAAEVTADTLNVRSGPSHNYYRVTELKAGDRVQVVGEESGWYAIVPPEDCFSLISQDYVDADEDGRTGVVNGNAVRVRAGSRLERKKYAVQRKLSKGDTVRIVGDDGEGYYKIVPPDGAVLWLHGDFVVAAAGHRNTNRTVSDNSPASAARGRKTKASAAPKTERPLSPDRDLDAIETVRAAEAPTGPRPFPPPGGAGATRPQSKPSGTSDGAVAMKEMKPATAGKTRGGESTVPVRDWTQDKVQTVAIKQPVSRERDENVIELVDAPDATPKKPTGESPTPDARSMPSADTIELVDSDSNRTQMQAPRSSTAAASQTQFTFDSQPAPDRQVATVRTPSAVQTIPLQDASSPQTLTPSDDSFDSPSVGIETTHNDSSALVRMSQPIERPDPYAGIDIQREDGAIKVVIDPIDPDQQLTVDEYRARLMELDAQFKSQLDRPVRQRDYEGMRRHFEELFAQDVDMYTKLYSARRIEQINAMESAALALMKIETQSDEVTAIRRQHMLERSQLQRTAPPIQRGFDAKGELRASLIYSSPAGPRRFRLIDPSLDTPRTLCYVEIPSDAQIDVDGYLGQIVGVYAREKYLQTGDVNPIAVLVAEQLVALGPAAVRGDESDERIGALPVGPTSAPSASGGDQIIYSSPSASPSSPSSQTSGSDMIEMELMEEYTPVASSEFQSGS